MGRKGKELSPDERIVKNIFESELKSVDYYRDPTVLWVALLDVIYYVVEIESRRKSKAPRIQKIRQVSQSP